MAGTGGDAGAGKMMATLVFVAGFLIIVLFLLSSFSPILQSVNYLPNQNIQALGFSAGEMNQYTFFNTTSGGNFLSVTPSDYCDVLSLPSLYIGINPIVVGGNSSMGFATGGDGIHVYPYHPNGLLTGSETRITLWRHWGIWDAKTVDIYYDDILAKVKASGNASAMTHRADIVISFDKTYTLFFIFAPGVDPAAALASGNNFKIALGQSFAQAYADAGKDAWGYVIGIITFDIPGGGTGVFWFDVILSLVVDAAIIFIAYWAITRLIGALMI